MWSGKRVECEKIGSLHEVKKDLLAGMSDPLANLKTERVIYVQINMIGKERLGR